MLANKIFSVVELGLWCLFVYGCATHQDLGMFLAPLALMAIYLLIPGLILGSQGWKNNLLAYGAGFILAWGLQTVVFHVLYWELLIRIPVLVFWPALILGVLCFFQTFRASVQRRFFAEVCVRMAIVTLFSAPFVLGWWIPGH